MGDSAKDLPDGPPRMLYHVPDIDTGRPDLPGVAGIEKLGGLPYGLPSEQWPVCKNCGRPQSFLAQFAHHAERLDLGRDGRHLFIFQCNHDPGMCSTWEAGSGANACIVVEVEDFTGDIPTPLPSAEVPVELEVWIREWLPRNDELDSELRTRFFDDDEYFALDADTRGAATQETKLGSVPFWIQTPNEAPKGYEFAGQLDCFYSFYSEPNLLQPWMSPDETAWEGRRYVAEGPNFGGGIAYLFVKNVQDSRPPDVVLFWQCG